MLIVLHSSCLRVSVPPFTYYNRTAYVGTTVKFPCPRKLKEAVIWARWSMMLRWFLHYLYLNGKMLDGIDRRLTVEENNSYALVISNVTADDSAVYGCMEHIGFGNRHFFILTVTGDELQVRRCRLNFIDVEIVSDRAAFVLKRDAKLQPTIQPTNQPRCGE